MISPVKGKAYLTCADLAGADLTVSIQMISPVKGKYR
jgi:hypothetical protein